MSAVSDPLAALLDMIRKAAFEGATEALAAQRLAVPPSSRPLVDKRELAHELRVSPATIDRLCRTGRIPFVRVGEVRRFDCAAVRVALEESGASPHSTVPTAPRSKVQVSGVRLLSRGLR